MWQFIKRNILSIILIALVAVFYFYQSGINATKIAEMKQRERELLQQVDQLEVQINKLRDYYELSQTPEFIERLAREKLKMVKPNEIIYFIDGHEKNENESGDFFDSSEEFTKEIENSDQDRLEEKSLEEKNSEENTSETMESESQN